MRESITKAEEGSKLTRGARGGAKIQGSPVYPKKSFVGRAGAVGPEEKCDVEVKRIAEEKGGSSKRGGGLKARWARITGEKCH